MDYLPDPPPRGYTSLAAVQQSPIETDMSVIGVIVDYMPPAPSKGTDWTCSFFLQDSSLLGSGYVQSGIRVRFFRPPVNMPQRLEIGDIVMVRNTRWRNIAGNNCLIDSKKTAEYLFFSSASIPDQGFKEAHVSMDAKQLMHETLPGKIVANPTAEEQAYIIKLRGWAKQHGDVLPQPSEPNHAPAAPKPQLQAQAPSTAPRPLANTGTTLHPLPPKPNAAAQPASAGAAPPSRALSHSFKFVNLKGIIEGKFHDLAGEVVKIFSSPRATVVDMYITDYTWNNFLYDYKEHGGNSDGRDGDPYGYTDAIQQGKQSKWNGPWGKRTICIGLYEPHAQWVLSEVREGDIVHIRNARCYRNEGQNLQGKLHTDARHPHQVDVKKLRYTDPLYQDIEVKKQEYLEERAKKDRKANKEPKAQKRKRKKLEKEARERAEADAVAKKAKLDADGDEIMQDAGVLGKEVAEDARTKLNPKVVSAHSDRPVLALTKILDTPFRVYKTRDGEENMLPFINQRVRSRVRVVDFFPHNLEDFAQNLDDADYNDVDSGVDVSGVSIEPTVLGSGSTQGRWAWHFFLRVEDAKPVPGAEPVRMNLLVADKHAQGLLGIDATDLRNNLQVKHQLERKLWTLWGELEELQRSGKWTEESKVANQPFECGIVEYGARTVVDGEERYERVHALVQTHIRD